MSDATPQLARPDAPGSGFFWSPALGAVLLFAVTSIPFVYAHAITPRDLVYTGLMTDVPDHAQYWSWVTASRTSLFISNTMTPEPNDPIFMNPWMWVLAQVKRAADLSFATLFQVWRMVATLLLVVCLAWFVREVIEEPTRRLTAVLVVLLGSGLGWALVVIKHLLGLSDVPYPLDVYVVEANSFWGLVSYPYVPLAQALILGTVTGAWTAHTRGRPSGFMLAVAGALALALFHAYDLITVYTVLGTWGVVVWLR